MLMEDGFDFLIRIQPDGVATFSYADISDELLDWAKIYPMTITHRIEGDLDFDKVDLLCTGGKFVIKNVETRNEITITPGQNVVRPFVSDEDYVPPEVGAEEPEGPG